MQWTGKLPWSAAWRALWANDILVHATMNSPINVSTNLNVLFSELIVAAGVTNNGDGTGTYELFNNTTPGWVAGTLSTADDMTFTFDPTDNLTLASSYTIFLSKTITGSATGRSYDGLSLTFTVV